jgi:hypothetical protein
LWARLSDPFVLPELSPHLYVELWALKSTSVAIFSWKTFLLVGWLVAWQVANPGPRNSFILWQALGITDLIMAVSLCTTARLPSPQGRVDGPLDGAATKPCSNVSGAVVCHLSFDLHRPGKSVEIRFEPHRSNREVGAVFCSLMRSPEEFSSRSGIIGEESALIGSTADPHATILCAK